MVIKVQEDGLFEEWSRKREYLVRDGVVNEQEYQKEPLKIMFVLKEVNDKDGGGWDLREYIRTGARGQTWNNVARWTYGLKNHKKNEPWEAVRDIDNNDRKEMLASVCAFNLKKTPGGATADNELVNEIAREDREFLNRQFGTYDPDIIICCGKTVSNTFYELIDFSSAPRRRTTQGGVSFCEFRSEKFIIDYIHPQAHVSAEDLYFGLVEAFREISG